MIFTYFAPGTPNPALDDTAYAARHAQQTRPTSVHDLDLLGLFDWVAEHTAPGRKGDAGYIVAGDCRHSRRADATGPAGFALIDYDDRPEGPDWELLNAYQGFAWTTAAGHPHWRVVIPFTAPTAHGALACPFPGGHIRNRSQPAFLPTGANIQWRVLEGAQTLDASKLAAPKAERKPREVGATQLPEHDEAIALELSGVWAHGRDGDIALGALGGWFRNRGVCDERIYAIAERVADLTQSTHPRPGDRACDDTNTTGRLKLQERLSIEADEGAVLLTLDSVEEMLQASVPGFVEARAPKPVSPWLCWSDLMAPLPPIDWLCKALQLAPGRPAALVAEPNAGKTWSLQAMALAVAAGLPIFGKFECAQGPVLHVSTDAGEYATRWRYQMLAKGMGLTSELPLKVWPGRLRCVSPRGEFKPEGLRPISDEATRGGYKLVILDSLFAIAAGLDMMAPEAAEPLWATKNLPGVWLWAMHSPKGKPGFFGSQAIGAACGAMWNMGLQDGDRNAPRVWTIGRRVEEFQGDAIEAFGTNWNKETNITGDLVSARVEWVELDPVALPQREDNPVQTRARVRQDIINLLIKEGPITQRYIRGAVIGSSNLIGELIRELVAQELVLWDGTRYHLNGARA